MPVDLLVSGSRLITPKGLIRSEIAIDGGKVVRFGRRASMPPADDIISLPSRSLTLPGVVDVHAHLRDFELSYKGDFASETQSAASGGITFVIDMPNSKPPTLSAKSIEEKKERTQGRIAVDLALNLGVYKNDEELIESKENMAFGEIFVGPSTGELVVDYEGLAKALRIIAGTGKVACIHAEDPLLFEEPKSSGYNHSLARPPEAEAQAVSRVLSINEEIGARLHFCHISTKKSLLTIGGYKSMGMQVTCEVTPHHLILTREIYDALGPVAKMNPPLRGPEDVMAMLEGVRSGIVDMIASDHAPHALEEKEEGEADAPSGVPGFETFIPAVLTYFEEKATPPSVLTYLSSTSPAQTFDVPGKGFGVGRDADLVVLDTRRREVDPDAFLSKAKYSPFSGMALKYWPIKTMLRGMVIAEDGEIIKKDMGRFISPGSRCQ